jgi:hypothetical protein
MFITDTVDALHRPPDWRPDSMMDQLAQIIGGIPDTRVSHTHSFHWILNADVIWF